MVNVIQPQKWTGEKTLNLASPRFILLHFTQQQLITSVDAGLFQPKMIIDSDFFGPYTRKISIMQCEMAGNVMERKGSELEW